VLEFQEKHLLTYRPEEASPSEDQKEGEKEAPEVESPIYETAIVSIPSADTVDLLGLTEAWHLMVLSRNMAWHLMVLSGNWPLSLHPPIIILVRLIVNWLVALTSSHWIVFMKMQWLGKLHTVDKGAMKIIKKKRM
jgi:hypothetical protein